MVPELHERQKVFNMVRMASF